MEHNIRPLLVARYGAGGHAKQLAQEMGISVRSAFRWITGETITDLDKLARHLGVPQSRLLHVPLPAIDAYINGPGGKAPRASKSATTRPSAVLLRHTNARGGSD